MASFPTYEPADFVNGITATQFRELTSEDNFSPILNRAIQGTYAPGSTFKLITALAALQEGVLGDAGLRRPTDLYLDTGTYTYSNCFEESSTCLFSSPTPAGAVRSISRLRCGSRATPTSTRSLARVSGPVRARFRRGRSSSRRGNPAVGAPARFGQRFGFAGPYERSGAVPDRDYYDRQFDAGVFAVDGSQWFAGATINLSIGQGELLVTPLQLANAYATFGNGGALHQPNVAVRVTDPDGEMVGVRAPVLRDLEIPEEFQAPIEEGLLGATMDTGGTATRAFGQADFNVWNWPVAGKTGTAEVDLKADTSLFAAYGPVYRPGSRSRLTRCPRWRSRL